MRRTSIVFRLSLLFLLVTSLVLSCDFRFDDGRLISPTSASIQTISPATLTAISAEAELNKTPVPDPMGIPWSDLDGLEIEFWHIWDLDEEGPALKVIIDRFNRENEWGITVIAVDQGLFQDSRKSVETAFEEGLIPNIMIIEDLPLAGWYQEGYIVDLNPFIEDPAAGYSTFELNDFYPGIFEDYTLISGKRPAIPFTQSIQVMFYNQSWGKELGFQTSPGSFADLVEQSCASSGVSQDDLVETREPSGGIILYPDAANITSLLYAYGGSILEKDAGTYQFTSREVRELGLDWVTMLQDRCGYMISGYPNPMADEIQIERFNNREALLVMSSSKNYQMIHMGANKTGRPDDWTMIPFVGPDGDRAVTAEVQSTVIFKSTPQEELGAWLFSKYLNSPQVQAEWIQISNSYPVRKDATRFLRDYRTDNPEWSLGLNLLKYGQANQLHPSWEVVQQALGDAFEAILVSSSRDMTSLLKQLDQLANELISYSEDN